MKQEASVGVTKYILVQGENPLNVERPATPLIFVNERMQQQLELMIAIKDYADLQRFLSPEPTSRVQVKLEEPPSLGRYGRELRERLIPAINDILTRGNIRLPGMKREDRYFTIPEPDKKEDSEKSD
jgi:hypothetical protein